MAQTTVAINLEAKTKGTESVKSLKTQINEATQEAIAMSQKFGEFSPQAIKAAQSVSDLKQQLDGVNKNISALGLNKFQTFSAVAGGIANGIQAAQGAMALFGAESEDAQKALLKVQGAMALAQGLEGIDKGAKAFKSLGTVAVDAFKSMTTASKAFLVTGVGLLIAGIATLIAYWDDIAESLGFATSEMQKMNKAMNIAAAETKTQAADLNFYNSVVQDTTKSEGEREFALQKLKEAGIATDDVNIANANSLTELNKRVAQQIVLIAQRARTEAAAQILQEKTKKLIEMQNGDLDDATTMWDKFYAGAKTSLMGVQYGTEELVKRGLNNVKEAQDDVNKATQVYQKERQKTTVLEGVAITTSKAVTSTLKARTEAQKNADKAAQEAAAKQAELNKRSAELLAQQELVGKTEVEKAKILAKRKFDESIKGFVEGSQEYIAAQKIFNEEVAKIDADAEAKAKELRDKQAKEREDYQKTLQDNITKANEAYFKSRELQILNSGKSESEIQKELDALMLEQLQSNIDQQNAIYGENSSEVLSAEIELTKKKKELYDQDVENRKNSELQKIELTKGGFQAIGELATAFAGKSQEAQKRAFEINKAANIANAIIDTYSAAQGAYASQMAIKTPDAPIRGAIAAGIAIAQGLARVAQIKKTQFQSKDAGGTGGGGGGAGTPAAPAMTPITGGALPNEQQFGGMGRVYVLEGDITKTQTRVRRLRNTSVV